jgi:DNA adenine methylase
MPNNCFPYPGNKARHSEWILEHIPEHECYVELFGGAAGVLFNKPRSKIEVYNDLNGDIPHFFKVLRDRGEELQEWLRNVPYSREVYNKWADAYYAGERCDDDIERAGRFFTLRYMQFGGKVQNKAGYRICKTAHDGSISERLRDATDSIPQFRERMKGVNIESLDCFKLIKKYDKAKTTFYADPPYEGAEGQYNAEGFNHRKLAEEAKETEGKMIISYDSIPAFYDESFNVVSKDSSFAIDGSGDNKDATEYLIMNYDSSGEPIMSDVGQQTLI